MQVTDLKHGQTVKARWGRAGRERVAWGPWRDVKLYVQTDRKGKPALIALDGVAWAEYTPRDLERYPTPHFQAEDYYLEIEGLT